MAEVVEQHASALAEKVEDVNVATLERLLFLSATVDAALFLFRWGRGQEIDLDGCTLAAIHKQDRLPRPSPAMRPRTERIQSDLQRSDQHLYLKPICLQTL